MNNNRMYMIYRRANTWYDIFDPIIRWVAWSLWSHCAVLMDENTVLEASFMGGVKLTPLSVFELKAANWEIRAYPVNDFSSIKAAGLTLVGRKYNKLAILGFLLHVGTWKGGKSLFCSEVPVEMCSLANQPIFMEKFIGHVSPQHLYMLPSEFVADKENPNWPV